MYQVALEPCIKANMGNCSLLWLYARLNPNNILSSFP